MNVLVVEKNNMESQYIYAQSVRLFTTVLRNVRKNTGSLTNPYVMQ